MARRDIELEAGERTVASEEDVQGEPLLELHSFGSARPRITALRGAAAFAALLAVGGFCALTLGRAPSKQEEASAFAAGQPTSRTQLQELPPTVAPAAVPPAAPAAPAAIAPAATAAPAVPETVEAAPTTGYADAEAAFEAQIHKKVANWTLQDKIAFQVFKDKVGQDQQEMKMAEGKVATAMSESFQKASTQTPPAVNHTTMQLNKVPPPTMGTVKDLYTFGAPGTAIDPLYDATTSDGCIAGLRTYTMGIRFSVGAGTIMRVNDPVAWICNLVHLKHANMESLQALQSNDNRNTIKKCGQGAMLPKADGFFWITGHMVYPKIMNWHREAIPGTVGMGVAPNDLSHNWRRRLAAASTDEELRRLAIANTDEEKVQKASLMAHFTFMNYHETPMITVDAPSWGWHLAGRACAATDVGPFPGVLGLASMKAQSQMQQTVSSFVDSCKDHTLLYQHNQTLECALVFEGSDDMLDWLSNLDFAVTPFCGLGYVHAGFRAKVLRMVGGVDYKQVIQPQIKHCASVTVAGHSLGGAQAELFTACANRMLQSNDEGIHDYRVVSFNKAKTKKLQEFHADHAQGVYLRNKGNGMCMDVKGTLSTDYRSPIILYWCEFPNAGFSQDQKWEMKADGSLINKRSGKCMVMDGSDTLVQMACSAGDVNQQWEVTPEHFLKNKGSKLCLDGFLKVVTCPYTDQKMEMKANGAIVNALTGLCMTVKPDPFRQGGGIGAGDDIVLGECDESDGSYSIWKLEETGAMVNKLTGLCMNLRPEQGREDRPTMMLGDCNRADHTATMLWMFQNGFFRNRRNGKCLDVKGMPGGAGSLFDINACEDKSVYISGLWDLMPGGFIRNVGKEQGQQYRCVSVAGEPWDTLKKEADGTPLVLLPCKINTDQKWEITPKGFIKNVIGGQKCVDLVPNTATGEMWLMNCADWDKKLLYSELKYSFTNGALRNKLYQWCVGLSPISKRGVLELVNCTEVMEAVKITQSSWVKQPNGAIQTGGQCLDVEELPGLGNTKAAVLNPCKPGSLTDTKQEWDVMENGFVINRYYGLCLTPRQWYVETHALLLLPCPVTTQLWEFLPSGQIKNRQSGKCIDAMRNTTGAWAWWNLAEWPCDESRKEQQWEQVA